MADIYPIFQWMTSECTITSPTNGYVFQTSPADITINVETTSEFAIVTLVEFFLDGVKVGEDPTAPYTWTIPNVTEGSYALIARVTNEFGAIKTSAPVFIEVVSAVFECDIVSPAEGSVFDLSETFHIEAEVVSSDAILNVEFFMDHGAGPVSVGYDITEPYIITVTCESSGVKTLTAVATNVSHETATSLPVHITVNSDPTCEITLPLVDDLEFAYGANILVRAIASDSDGTIEKVEFFVDSISVGEDLYAPYSFVLSNLTVGTHELTAKATDNRGKTGESSPRRIKIKQTPIGLTETTPPVTTSNISFCQSWNRRPSAIVELTAVDYANTEHDIPSGVFRTYYAIDPLPETVFTIHESETPAREFDTTFTVSGQGEFQIHFFSVDYAGNVEQTKKVYLRLDEVPPITSCTANILPNENGWYQTKPEITLSANDPHGTNNRPCSEVSKIFYRINSSGVFNEIDGDFYRIPDEELSSEGIYTIQYYSVDHAGNVEDVQTTFFKYDAHPPVTRDDITPGIHKGPTTINFYASDLFSGVYKTYYTLDGTLPTTSSPSGSFVTITETGFYIINYLSVDLANNFELVNTKPIRVIIDTTGPDTYIYESFHINGNNGWYKTSPEISIAATDPSGIKEIMYKLYPEGVSTTAKYTSTVDISATVNLTENYFIRLEIDQTGQFFEVDLRGVIPFQTTITEIVNAINSITGNNIATETGPDGLAGNGYVTLTSPTAGTGSSTSEIRFLPVLSNDATEEVFGQNALLLSPFTETVVFVPYTEPFILPADNFWQVEYYSVDNDDNQSQIASKRYKLDSENPVTSVNNSFEPDGNNGWYITNPVITLSSEDNLSGVYKTYYRWDETCWQEYFVGTEIQIPSQGQHYLEIYSIDYAGNEEEHQRILYKFDYTSPVTSDDTINYQGIIFTTKGSGHQQVVDENPVVIDPYHVRVKNPNVVAVPYFYNISNSQEYAFVKSTGIDKDEIEVIPFVRDEDSTRLGDFNIQLLKLESSVLSSFDDVTRVYNKTKSCSYSINRDLSTQDGNLVLIGTREIELGDKLEVDYKFSGKPLSYGDVIDITYAYDISHDPQVSSSLNYTLTNVVQTLEFSSEEKYDYLEYQPVIDTLVVTMTFEGSSETLIKDVDYTLNNKLITLINELIIGQVYVASYEKIHIIDYNAVVHLFPTDASSYIEHTYHSLDYNENLPPEDAFDLATWVEGTVIELSSSDTYKIFYYSIDAAGNVEPVKKAQFEITIDKREPDLQLEFNLDPLENGENGWFKYNFDLNVELWSNDRVNRIDEDVVEANTHVIIAGQNDRIDFEETVGVPLVATIAAGTYTSQQLVTEIQNQLNNSGSFSYIVSLVESSVSEGYSFKIETNPTNNFSLLWATGANISRSIGNTIGFGSTNIDYLPVDKTGGHSYLSTYYKIKLANQFVKSVEEVKSSISKKQFTCIEILQGADGLYDEILIATPLIKQKLNISLTSLTDYLSETPIAHTLIVTRDAIPLIQDVDYTFSDRAITFEIENIIDGANYVASYFSDPINSIPLIIDVNQNLNVNPTSLVHYLDDIPMSGTLVVTENSIPLIQGVDYEFENGTTITFISALIGATYIAHYSLKDKVLVDYTHYIGLEKVALGLESTSLLTEVQIYNDVNKFVSISNDRVNYLVSFPRTSEQFYSQDGSHSIYAQVYDNNTVLGTGAPRKQSTIRSIPFKLDRVAPLTTDNAPTTTDWIKAPLTILLSPDDTIPGSGVANTFYTTDGLVPSRVSSEGTTINLGSSGVYDVQYFSVDIAGNEETTKSCRNLLNVDAEPPITAINVDPSTPDGENWWYKTQPEISFTVIDIYSGVNQTFYRINDDLAFIEYTGIPFLLPVEGAVTITYYSTDNVGNIEQERVSVVKYDITPPETTTDAPLLGYTSHSIVNFVVVDTGSGVATTYYTTDGTDPNMSSPSGSFVEFSSSGTYTLKFFSIDNAGNVETIKTQVVNIDLEASEVSNFTPVDCIITDSTTEISFQVSDSLSGVNIDSIEVDVDGVIYSTQKNSSYFSYTGTQNFYTIVISPITQLLNFQDVEILKVKNITDFAGNVTPTLEFNLIKPDLSSPWVRETYPAPNVQDVSTNSNVIAFIDDSQSGVDIKTVVVNINSTDFKINFRNILRVQYTGSANSATLQIYNKSLITYVDSLKDISISFYESNYNTVKKIELYLNSLPDYSAEIIDTRFEQIESTLLLNVASLNIKQQNIVDFYLPEENLNFSFIERGKGYLVFASPSFSFEHKVPVSVKIYSSDNSGNVMDAFSYVFIPHIYATTSVKKRNYLNRVALEYIKDIQENIASNYSRSKSTNFYGHHKAISLELSRFQDSFNDLNLDRDYNTLRPLYLYEKLGYLLDTKPVTGLSHDDYRRLLLSLISIFFKGSLKSSIEEGVALFLGTDVKIIEVVFTKGSDISDQFVFTADIIINDKFTGVDLVALSNNLTHVFNLVKPAHVFVVQRFSWTDSFDFQAGCVLLWEQDLFGNYVIDQFGNRVPQIAYDGYQAAETQSDTAICDRFKYSFVSRFEEDMREDCSESMSALETYTDNVSPQFTGTENFFYISRIPVLSDSTHVAITDDIIVTINGLPVVVLSIDPLTGLVVIDTVPIWGDVVEVTYLYNQYFIYRIVTFYLNDPDSVFGGGSEYFYIEDAPEDDFALDSGVSSMLIEKRKSILTREIIGRIQIPEVMPHAHVCDKPTFLVTLPYVGEPYIGLPYPGSIEEDPTITNPDFPEDFDRISEFREPLVLGEIEKITSSVFIDNSGYSSGITMIHLTDFKNSTTVLEQGTQFQIEGDLTIYTVSDNVVVVPVEHNVPYGDGTVTVYECDVVFSPALVVEIPVVERNFLNPGYRSCYEVTFLSTLKYFTYLNDTRYRLGAVSLTNKMCRMQDVYTVT